MAPNPPLSPIRKSIVNIAIKYAGKIGGPPGSIKGVDYMMDMYRQTISGPSSLKSALGNPVLFAQIKEGTRQGLWISKQYRPHKQGYYKYMVGINEQSKGISWCGIFAAWILKQAGLNVSWYAQGDKGLKFNVTKIERILLGSGSKSACKGIQAGDVCVTNTFDNNQHHVLVVSASTDKDVIKVVEGNIAAAQRHVVRQSDSFRKSQFHTWYRIKDDDWHKNHFAVDGRWLHRRL